MQYSLRADGTVSTFISAREIAAILTGKTRHKSGGVYQYVNNRIVMLPDPRLYPKSGGYFFGTDVTVSDNGFCRKFTQGSLIKHGRQDLKCVQKVTNEVELKKSIFDNPYSGIERNEPEDTYIHMCRAKERNPPAERNSWHYPDLDNGRLTVSKDADIGNCDLKATYDRCNGLNFIAGAIDKSTIDK